MSASVTATFVFTDLVDSTATSARLGPATAEDLRQTHFRLLRGAVAGSGGTEVKNLGDGLMVMYSSPSHALAGAVGMQQAIHHHNRSAGEPLGVRIGIDAGEAVEEDDDFFGDPVVEAARLSAAAEGGQILAKDLVRLMVGRHATQTFVEVGPLELKGLPDPVEAVEVQWEPVVVEGSVALPGRLLGAAANGLFGFFGRASELEVLVGVCKRARASRRCELAFVAGEAGMGKTALVAQAARGAHADGTVVLFGHVDEDLGVAYQPWIEALSVLVREGDPELFGSLRAAQRGALALLIPEIGGGDTIRVADPDTERLLLLEAVVELLAVASRDEPVLVVLDDVHWIDTASIQLLRHVIASSTQMDVTIVCTYRDTDLGRGDPLTKLLADMHREPNVTRIALQGLDDLDIVELIAAAAGHDLDDAGLGLAHALYRETSGNPFYTGEMLRHLGETGGIILSDDGRWRLAGELEELGLPTSVRDVVGRRVERLGEDAMRVLSLAAVIGREFDLALLSGLVDIGEDPLLDLMDVAVGAAVLVESDADRYRFAHALIQHTLYDELSPARRQRAHQRVGEALEEGTHGTDAAALAELATHWIAATRPADFDKAIDYARRAGDAALEALAPDDAAGWYQQALDLVERQVAPDDRRSAELLAALGGAQRQAALPQFRESLFRAADLARQLDDVDVLVAAALGFRRPIEGSVGDPGARPIIEAALGRIGTDATPTRARLLVTLASTYDVASETDDRRELSLQALDDARRSDDDAAFLDVVSGSGVSLMTADRREQAIADVWRAVAIADRVGDAGQRARLGFPKLWARYQKADIDGVDADLANLEELADMTGLAIQRWTLGILRAGRELLAGHIDESEVHNERSLQVGLEANMPEAFGTYGGILYLIRLHQGRLDEIADLFLDAARDNPSIAVLRAEVPRMLCELGRFDEATERLGAEAAVGFEYPNELSWSISMSAALDAACTLGDRGAAEALVGRVSPFADHVGATTIVEGAMARPLARGATLLGDYNQAEKWFALAHDVNARLRAPFWIALAHLDHADLCLARRADDDLQRARDFVTTAAATAAEYGCAGLTTRAAALLRGL